jgi:hypothetical protein
MKAIINTMFKFGAALLVWMVIATPARADNWGRPMSFTLGPHVFGPVVVADGDIEPDTASKLEQFLTQNHVPINAELWLTSRGGNLDGGLQMGEVIRSHRLHTNVASDAKVEKISTPPTEVEATFRTYPSYCISACTFAFLGGVERSIVPGSTYRVHQASMECRDPGQAAVGQSAAIPTCPNAAQAISDIQHMFGDLVAYAQKMGVDPAFLKEMVSVDPSNTKSLSEDQMRHYKILFAANGATWTTDSSATGGLYLQVLDKTEWKTNTLRFYCRRTPKPQLVIDMIHDPADAGGGEDVSHILAVGQKEFRYGGSDHDESFILSPSEIIRAPFKTADGKVELEVAVSARIYDALHSPHDLPYSPPGTAKSQWKAEYFEFSSALQGPDSVRFFFAKIDRVRLDGFMEACI